MSLGHPVEDVVYQKRWCVLKNIVYSTKRCCVSAREASWRRAFDPCTPLLFDLYHFREQNGYFGLVTENPILIEPGSILVDGFDTRLIPRSFSCGMLRSRRCCVSKKMMCIKRRCVFNKKMLCISDVGGNGGWMLKCMWMRIVMNNDCWHVSRGSNELMT